jgi:hypothetical protein
MDTLPTFISGALLTAVIAALIAGFFVLYSKHTEYKNSYLKMIVDKRVSAYEHLNVVIQNIKVAKVDNNKAYYHIFSNIELFDDFYKLMYNTQSYEFWMSDHTKSALLKLHQELTHCYIKYQQGNELIAIGKEEYETIAKLRDSLEINILYDFPNIYKVEQFFKNKQVVTSFETRDISKRPD